MNASRLALCAAGIGAALAFAAAAPATAAPPAAAGLAAAPDTGLMQVAARKHPKKYRHSHRRGSRAPDRRYDRPVPSYDNVGSVGQDGYGYGYNRFSGQRYQTCVFDEGYGRTQPCDAGGGGGSRN